jgi:tetrathionate reductase subunit B
MSQSRRTFLKLAVGAAAAATVNSAGRAQLAEAQTTPLSQHQPRWGMVIDLRKCIGCQACTVACSMENLVPLGQFRTIVSTYEVDVAGDARRATLPRLCNHCENPPCVEVCPTQATYQREDGIVVVDNTVCIGCGYCVQACPYDARFINPETHTVDKCNFCVHRVDAGLLPACVETCVGGARVFGDLNDLNSKVSRLLREYSTQVLKPSMGTEPRVFYIGLAEYLQASVEGEQALWSREEILTEVGK